MRHIEFRKLVENFEGSPSETENRLLSAHLAECAECAARFKKLEDFFKYARAGRRDEQAGHNLTARLLNIFQPKKKAAGKSSFVRKLLANLVFDDWQMALNERLLAADTRQLLFRAEDYEIDLRLNFAGDKCVVSGQVFPDCQSGTAELLSADLSRQTVFNRDCEFIFPPVKQGLYQLMIKVDGVLIETGEFSLLT
ncbi:MAG: hypothetical protein R2747_21755 [Pyrinomonadaceae bacterium]